MAIEFWKTNENPITCYRSRKNKAEVTVKIPKRISRDNKQPVLVEFSDGKLKEYDSVSNAAIALNMKSNTLCCILNGRAKQQCDFKVYKKLKTNN